MLDIMYSTEHATNNTWWHFHLMDFLNICTLFGQKYVFCMEHRQLSSPPSRVFRKRGVGVRVAGCGVRGQKNEKIKNNNNNNNNKTTEIKRKQENN